jgi:hypothetical protein
MSDKTYKVTDTRELQTLTQAGNSVTVYRVWLVTDRGATGTVDVAKKDWTDAKLRPILDARAEELDLAFSVLEA